MFVRLLADVWPLQRGDGETPVFLEGLSPFAVEAKEWASQHEPATRQTPLLMQRAGSTSASPDRRSMRQTFSFGRKPAAEATAKAAAALAATQKRPSLGFDVRIQRNRAHKHIVDRMIGIQASPFKCGSCHSVS